MRIYIDGTLSNQQNTFLPKTLWFATKNCDDNASVSYECLRLDGITCETSVTDKEFSCRWKGVELSYVDDQGNNIETEDFTTKDLVALMKKRKMQLVNMSAYCDNSAIVKITRLTMIGEDHDARIEFDTSLVDEIDLIE